MTLGVLPPDRCRELEIELDEVLSALKASDERAIKFRKAVDYVTANPTCVPALVSLAVAIQVGEPEAAPSLRLDDALQLLRWATKLAGRSADAPLELGHFLYAVENDSMAALDVVEAALTVLQGQTRDLLQLKVEVLQDLGRHDEAQRIAGGVL